LKIFIFFVKLFFLGLTSQNFWVRYNFSPLNIFKAQAFFYAFYNILKNIDIMRNIFFWDLSITPKIINNISFSIFMGSMNKKIWVVLDFIILPSIEHTLIWNLFWAVLLVRDFSLLNLMWDIFDKKIFNLILIYSLQVNQYFTRYS